MSDSPYKQKAPLPGQSVDLVPDESPITIADMIRQEGGSIPKAMTRHRNGAAEKALAPSKPSTPFDWEKLRTERLPFLDSFESEEGEGSDSPDVLDGLTSEERLEQDREKFGEVFDHNRIHSISVGQEWPKEKKDWAHGTFDQLKKDAPGGDWQLTNEAEDGTLTFIDLKTGQETDYRWDGEE